MKKIRLESEQEGVSFELALRKYEKKNCSIRVFRCPQQPSGRFLCYASCSTQTSSAWRRFWCRWCCSKSFTCIGTNWLFIQWISRKRSSTLYLSFSQWTWRNTWTGQFPGMSSIFRAIYFAQNGIWTLYLCRQGHMDATLIKSYTYQLFQVNVNDVVICDHCHLLLLTGAAFLPPATSDAQRLEAGQLAHRQGRGECS